MSVTAFNPEFARLLREISGAADVDNALRVLGGEKAPAVAPEEPRAQPVPAVREVAALRRSGMEMYDDRTVGLLRSMERMAAALGALQKVVDREVPNLIGELGRRINSHPTADQAVNLYDVLWFQRQPYSNSAKVSIAAALVDAVTPFYGSSPVLWQRLVARDPDTLRLVAYTEAAVVQ